MKRIIHSDNGTLQDLSVSLSDYHASTEVVDFVNGEDYVYIGSQFPFNSMFVDVSVANDQASVMSMQYWDGSSWQSMVEVIDETASSGVSLAQSGYVTWVPDKNYKWMNEDTVHSNGTEKISGLGDVTIYDLYWIRVNFSADLAGTTAINWAGPKFCTDADLTGEYTLFSNSTFKSAYESGKTSWEREIILATSLLIDDLKSNGVIFSGDQLLDKRVFRDACVMKAAEVIFKNLGDDYVNDVDRARTEYTKRLNKSNYSSDQDADARLDKSEAGVRIGGLYR